MALRADEGVSPGARMSLADDSQAAFEACPSTPPLSSRGFPVISCAEVLQRHNSHRCILFVLWLVLRSLAKKEGGGWYPPLFEKSPSAPGTAIKNGPQSSDWHGREDPGYCPVFRVWSSVLRPSATTAKAQDTGGMMDEDNSEIFSFCLEKKQCLWFQETQLRTCRNKEMTIDCVSSKHMSLNTATMFSPSDWFTVPEAGHTSTQIRPLDERAVVLPRSVPLRPGNSQKSCAAVCSGLGISRTSEPFQKHPL